MNWFWWLGANQEQNGPVEEAEALELTASGEIRADTLVWTEGMADWELAEAAPILGDRLRDAPPLAPASAAPTAEAPQPEDFTTDALDGAPNPNSPARGLIQRLVSAIGGRR